MDKLGLGYLAVRPPKPEYKDRKVGWIKYDGFDMWQGADASDLPEIDPPYMFSFVELSRLKFIREQEIVEEIVIEQAEDDNYYYIFHRYPSAGGDTGTIIRYNKLLFKGE